MRSFAAVSPCNAFQSRSSESRPPPSESSPSESSEAARSYATRSHGRAGMRQPWNETILWKTSSGTVERSKSTERSARLSGAGGSSAPLNLAAA